MFLNQQIQVILPVFCLTQSMWMFKKLRSVCELANATLPVTEHELSHPALSELVSTVNVCKPGKTPESTVFEPANLRMRLSHGDSLIHKPNIHEANLPVFCTPQRQSLQLYKWVFFSKATPVPSPLPVPALRVAMVQHILHPHCPAHPVPAKHPEPLAPAGPTVGLQTSSVAAAGPVLVHLRHLYLKVTGCSQSVIKLR